MLSVSNSLYELPSYDASVDKWLLQSRKSPDECLIARTFNYTLFDGDGKYTFIYDGKSVKPTPRTLRVYGADHLQPIVSKLARKTVRKVVSDSSDDPKSLARKGQEGFRSLDDILASRGLSHFKPVLAGNPDGDD